jgi:hypothetical protein
MKNNSYTTATAAESEDEPASESKDSKNPYEAAATTTQKTVIYSNSTSHDTLWVSTNKPSTLKYKTPSVPKNNNLPPTTIFSSTLLNKSSSTTVPKTHILNEKKKTISDSPKTKVSFLQNHDTDSPYETLPANSSQTYIWLILIPT